MCYSENTLVEMIWFIWTIWLINIHIRATEGDRYDWYSWSCRLTVIDDIAGPVGLLWINILGTVKMTDDCMQMLKKVDIVNRMNTGEW